jgi:signal transduction histidine kinase
MQKVIHRKPLLLARFGKQPLLGTLELLGKDAEARKEFLILQARRLILRLKTELEQLAYQAERELRPPVQRSYNFVISSLLLDLKNDWGPEADSKRLQFKIASDACLVKSDQRLLAVILNNIVGNAVKHTARGGVTISTSIEGGNLVVSVCDTGPGIADEDLLRSYHLSSRTHRRDEGMGLGLSIARKTAEILGHRFEVSTASDRGTSIRLFIPLADSSASRSVYDSLGL